MLLALDVGNTETVIGVFSDGRASSGGDARVAGELVDLAHHWRISTVAERTHDELALLLIELAGLVGLRLPRRDDASQPREAGGPAIDGIAISSSVPAVTASVREMVWRWFDLPLVVVEPGIRMGMPVLYDNPREVGADRIVNAVGVLDLYGGPAIVVDLGTATTFDVISPAGEYLGGVIAPGLEISMDAVVASAAALRHVELLEPGHVIGRSTVESMQSGAIFGHAAMIDGLCERIIAELGAATIVATGGLGGLVAPHTKRVEHFEPWLTLHGLRLVYEQNRSSAKPGTAR